jgi:hypothetical protein
VSSCFLANAERTSCGWSGMSAQTCADRGCCWDSSTGGIPWCFYAQAAPDNATAPGPTLRYAGAQSAPTVASLLGAGHAAIAGDHHRQRPPRAVRVGAEQFIEERGVES